MKKAIISLLSIFLLISASAHSETWIETNEHNGFKLYQDKDSLQVNHDTKSVAFRMKAHNIIEEKSIETDLIINCKSKRIYQVVNKNKSIGYLMHDDHHAICEQVFGISSADGVIANNLDTFRT